MRYAVEIENAPDITVYQYRGAGREFDLMKLREINPQPLPTYVSELAVQNTELSETVSQYKDFVTSICHALGVSLSLTQGEIVNEIHRLKRRFGEVEKELLFTVERLESVKAIENDRRVGLLQDKDELKKQLTEAAERLEQKERLLQAAIKDSDHYREQAKEYEAVAIDMGNDLLAVREKLKEVEAEANDLHAENRTLKDQEASLHLQLLGARSGRESWHREYDKAIKDIEVLQAENTRLKEQEASLRLELLSTQSNRELWRCEWHQALRRLAALEAANAALVKERNDAIERLGEYE